MSISRIGTNTASSTTVTVPGHVAGDLILIWAVRAGSATAPTLPSGFKSLQTKANGANVSARLGYKWATGTGDTSGTWTNATELVCAVYRASAGNTIQTGQSNSSSSTTATIPYPVLSPMADGGGNSWAVGFFGANNITQSMPAPSGMTNVTSITGSTAEAAIHDTNAGVASWSATNATASGAGNSVTVTLELVLVTESAGAFSTNVYQHVGGGGNPFAQAQACNSFKIPLPHSSASGNTFVLGFSCDGGATVSSVSGSVNGSFGAAAVTSLQGTGNIDSYVYVLQNISSGQETVTVTFSANVAAFQYVITELYGVATSGGTQGTASNGATQSTSTSTGSFTPTNNNGTGGNLIWAYYVKSDQTPGNLTTGIFPGANFTLLNADTGWGQASFSIPKACQAYVQATSAAINPTIVSVAETGDHWNSLAVALKISSGSGAAPGTGGVVYKVDHFATDAFPASGTYALQVPAFGNLRVICSDDPALNAQTVTDSEGNTWTAATSGTGIWYLLNSSPNPNLEIFLTGGGGDVTLSWRYLDAYGNGTWAFDSAGSVASNLASTGTSFSLSPSPAPAHSPGLMVVNVGLGNGPGRSVTAPVGAIWDLCTYTGEVDTDLIENADIMAHLFYAASGSQTWTFTCDNSTTTSGGTAAFQFTAAAGDSPTMQILLWG